jgi:lipid-A-disaccharide synthase
MTLLISAGEVSGDAIAARIVTALRARLPDLRVVGLGGPRMRQAGVVVDEDTLDIGAVGIAEAVGTVPAVVRATLHLRRRVRRERPAAAVLIGNDIYHAMLGRWLRRRGVHTIAYFPPQVWVWKPAAAVLGRAFDTILSSFEEEQDVYARACPQADVRYVGHYLADSLHSATEGDRMAARRVLDLAADRPVVGLFPGSRAQEIRELLAIQLDAAWRLHREDPRRQVILSLADRRHDGPVTAAVGASGLANIVRVLPHSANHDVMRAADVLLVASGTTTLEAALIGTPMVILYRVTPLTWAVIRTCLATGLLRSDTMGLPNILLREACVPELKQAHARGDLAADAVRAILLDEAARMKQVRGLARVRQHLARRDAIAAVADTVVATLAATDGRRRRSRAGDVASPRTTGAVGGP